MPAPFTIKSYDIVNKRSLTRSFVISKFGCIYFIWWLNINKNIYCKYCKYAIGFFHIYCILQYAIIDILLHFNLHPKLDITNDPVRLLLLTIWWNSLYRDFLIVKGAGICSVYHEIHYIKIRYIEVWVYISI